MTRKVHHLNGEMIVSSYRESHWLWLTYSSTVLIIQLHHTIHKIYCAS